MNFFLENRPAYQKFKKTREEYVRKFNELVDCCNILSEEAAFEVFASVEFSDYEKSFLNLTVGKRKKPLLEELFFLKVRKSFNGYQDFNNFVSVRKKSMNYFLSGNSLNLFVNNINKKIEHLNIKIKINMSSTVVYVSIY